MSSVIAFPPDAASVSISYSYGVGVKDNHPEQRVVTSFRAFSEAILNPLGPAVPRVIREAGKVAMRRWKATAALPWFTAPLGGDGIRCASNAQAWPVFVMDIDEVQAHGDKSPVEVLLDFVAATRKLAPCFGYTTGSHTDGVPRARMVLHLDRPVDSSESKQIAASVADVLNLALGLTVGMAPATVVIDKCMQDAAQIAFGPLEGTRVFELSEVVPPLDVEAYMSSAPRTTAGGEREKWAIGRPYHAEAEVAVRDALVRLDKRHPEAVHNRKEWLRVLAALKAHNWADEVMAPIAEGWSAQSPKFDEGRFRTDWDSLQPEGGISASTLYFLAGQAHASANEQEGHLSEIDLSDVMSSELPEPGFLLPPLLPRGQVTLLGGHGGVGKSMLALEMAAHIAAGQAFAGFPIDTPANVVFISLEDDRGVVMPRLRHVMEHFQLPDMAFLNLRIFDHCGGYGALMTEVPGAGLEATELMTELEAAVSNADLIVIDNASEAFDGNENARRHVRQFIAALRAVGQAGNAVILLLAHIDKAAAIRGARDNSYSGSTAWHNSARSRLALVVEDSGIELRHEKSNYAPPARPVRFIRGAFGILEPYRVADQAKDFQIEENLVFRALVSAVERGIRVPTATTGGRTSWHALIEAGLSEPLSGGKRRVEDVLRSLESGGLIARQFTMNPHRKLSQVWEIALA